MLGRLLEVLEVVDDDVGRRPFHQAAPVLEPGDAGRQGGQGDVRLLEGELLGVAPKSYVPTYREFYERRWYAPGDDQRGEDIRVGELEAPFGPDLLFEALDIPGLVRQFRAALETAATPPQNKTAPQLA